MDQKQKRLQLQQEFEDILGSKNVYFQPPETMKMNYPCIIYFKSPLNLKKADNKVYNYTQGYSITYVDKDPDSEVPYTILKHFSYARIDSYYRAENLNHTKITIFY